MALARGRWAEPLKTTTFCAGTGTPRWLGRAVGVRVTRPGSGGTGRGHRAYQRSTRADSWSDMRISSILTTTAAADRRHSCWSPAPHWPRPIGGTSGDDHLQGTAAARHHPRSPGRRRDRGPGRPRPALRPARRRPGLRWRRPVPRPARRRHEATTGWSADRAWTSSTAAPATTSCAAVPATTSSRPSRVRDRVFMGAGNDELELPHRRRRSRAVIDCGSGHDVVNYLGAIDTTDVIRANCEDVNANTSD